MKTLGSAGLAVNIGGYIGFNAIWQNVVGNTDRRPNPEEIERMRALIASGLDQGAWGVSAGLDYKPGYFARTEEVIKVVDVARPARTNFTNHDRITPESNFSSKVGVAETVAIGEKAGLVAGRHAHESAGPRTGDRRRSCSHRWRRRPGAAITPRRMRIRISRDSRVWAR